MELLETQIKTNTIIVGDSRIVLEDLESKTVDLVITSPPYFQQLDYGNGDLGIGSEKLKKNMDV
jgi:DNA modification methylase